jgi:hypothetical protein
MYWECNGKLWSRNNVLYVSVWGQYEKYKELNIKTGSLTKPLDKLGGAARKLLEQLHKNQEAVSERQFKNSLLSWVWWCISVIPALRRERQEEPNFQASLSYTARLCLKKLIIKENNLVPVPATPLPPHLPLCTRRAGVGTLGHWADSCLHSSSVLTSRCWRLSLELCCWKPLHLYSLAGQSPRSKQQEAASGLFPPSKSHSSISDRRAKSHPGLFWGRHSRGGHMFCKHKPWVQSQYFCPHSVRGLWEI